MRERKRGLLACLRTIRALLWNGEGWRHDIIYPRGSLVFYGARRNFYRRARCQVEEDIAFYIVSPPSFSSDIGTKMRGLFLKGIYDTLLYRFEATVHVVSRSRTVADISDGNGIEMATRATYAFARGRERLKKRLTFISRSI